jgi:hypothetical protein
MSSSIRAAKLERLTIHIYRYSQGKATALIVDVGHLNTSVTALYDGMVLRKGEMDFDGNAHRAMS